VTRAAFGVLIDSSWKNCSRIDDTPNFLIALKLLYGEYIYVSRRWARIGPGGSPAAGSAGGAMNYFSRPDVLQI